MEGLWEYLIRDTDLVVDTHEGAKRWSSILYTCHFVYVALL